MKNKLFNKKWLVLLMAVMLIVLSITGCGGKEDDDDEDGKKKDDEEPTPEPDVEATPEPTAEPTPEPTAEPVADEDWETAYEDYFETWGPLVEENAVVIVSGYEGDVYMEMAYGYSGEYSAFSMEVDDAYFELITDPDMLYYYSETADDYEWAVSAREDGTDADFMGMADSMDEMLDDIEYDYYIAADEYDVIYDIVACYVEYEGEECEAIAYINRETQNMELLELEDSEGNLVDVEVLFPGEDGFMEMIDETIAEYDGVDVVSYDELGNKVLDFLLTMIADVEMDEPAEPAEPTGSTGVEADDWSTAYDDFFADGISIPEAFEITTSIDVEGFVLDYMVAQDAGISLIRYRIGDYGVDAYTDGSVIVMENIGLNGSEWVYAEITSGDDMADILGADFTELMGGVTDSVSSSSYVEAVEEDGVVYDVLEIDTDDTPALVYVDRDRQVVSKMIIEAEGLEMVCKFEGFPAIEVPAGADSATEMTKDELANYYSEAMIESVMASMGMEY